MCPLNSYVYMHPSTLFIIVLMAHVNTSIEPIELNPNEITLRLKGSGVDLKLTN